MQFAPAALEQAIIDGVPDEGMREQAVLAMQTHKMVRDETIWLVVGPVKQGLENVALEALTEDRGDLRGNSIQWIEPIQARLHEALNGSRDAALGARFRVAQELLEKQGIAGRTGDAPVDRFRAGGDQRVRHRAGILFSKWPHVQGHERSRALDLPSLPERITLGSRRRHKDERACRGGLPELCEVDQR